MHAISKAPAAHLDGIADLINEHRQIEQWFSQWQCNNTLSEEDQLARRICAAISMHLELETQVFYPAFAAATHDDYHYRTGLEDHAALQDLITEIQFTSVSEDAFFAKVHLLCEQFSQHVSREEEERGIFIRARDSNLDLVALADAMRDRRVELHARYDLS